MSALSDDQVDRLGDLLMVPALPPRYRPIEVIGRGGMGVVWRAHDEVLEREVAIKVLAEHLDDAAALHRLEREARILARLEHPGIVAVHDAGVLDDGRVWYAMRLVRGVRLDEAARTGRIASAGEAVRLVVRLAETVAFAHANEVLHRDLTPRNVMLGPFGEVLILDWGVARELGREQEPAGMVVGTPGYQAPEQAAGRAADRRSDVYGLGAILRDVLTAAGAGCPDPLASIRDTALAESPMSRYPDAVAFRDDLLRWLDGERVHAHRERALERLSRVLRPYQTAIVLVLAYLVMRILVLWWRGI